MRTLFKSDEEDYCKPIRIGNAFSSNCIEYESKGDKDKMFSIKNFLDKIEPYLNNLIDDHRLKVNEKFN